MANNGFPTLPNGIVRGGVGELKVSRKKNTPQQIEQELTSKWNPEEVVDEFEKLHGTKSQESPIVFSNWKPVQLRPGVDPAHQQLYADIQNNLGTKYAVKGYQSTFNARGDYICFFSYGINLDYKEEKKDDTQTP